MGLAEEEVLIRDDSGLLLDVGETRVPKSQEWTKKLTKTICLSLGFLVLGLCVAIPGPTLLDLEDQVKATTFEMMIVFASRSMGYLLGALLGGVLFDCFDKQLLLFCTLLVSSVATVAIPWSLTLVVMATMFALQGVTMGALDTGGNVFCIQLWGKKNPPFIQTLHFAFGIGAFVAPLLAKPFLSNGSVVPNTTSIVQGNIPVAPFLTDQLHSNITRRSPEYLYPNFDRANDDLLELINGKKEEGTRNEFSEISLMSRIVEGGHDINLRGDKLKDIHERLKRQSGNEDDGYSGMWKWKRYKSKRESPNNDLNDPTAGTTTAQQPGNTDESLTATTEEADVGPDQGTTETAGIEITDGKIDKSKIKPGLDPDSSQNSKNSNSSTANVADKTTKVSDASKAKSNISAIPNAVLDSEVTTIITTQSTTKEVKVHKPSAATDSNREPSTADGKVISSHLNDHKDEIPVNNGEDSESDTGSTSGDEIRDTTPDLDKVKDQLVNVTASAGVDAGNISSSNNSKAINVTQFSSISNNSKENATSLSSGVSSTVKPTNFSEEGDASNGTVSPEQTDKPSTKLDTTTTEAATTTTTKLTTTTTKPPPPSTTTTTEKTTTEKVTTTIRPTTTTVKVTTTTEKVTTTEKLTPAPTTKEKTTESSTKKTTPFKIPTQDESNTNKGTITPSTQMTTVPKITSTNSSVTVVSLENTTLFNDKASTTEVSLKPESTVDSFLNNAIHVVKNISKIQFAYLIIGLALFLIAIVFLVLYCKDKRRLTPGRDLEEFERFGSSVTCAKAVLILLLGVFFFCYMGLEVTFGALVTTFAVDYNKWPKEQGAMAAAIFWGSLAAGRGLSIFLSRCCGPTVMLIIDLIFMIIGGLVLSIGIHFFDKLLWLGTLILGLGMSSAFPAGISWAEKYFHLTGKSTAVFVIGSALGQMIVPVVTGYLYEYLGAIVLMYASLALSVFTLVIFILMQCVAAGRGVTLKVQERNGFLPLEDDDDGNEENLEMDDFIHFDKSQARLRRDKRGGGNAEYHTLISDLDDD